MLAIVLPRGDREHLLLEMDDLFARRARRSGRTQATLWYLWRVAGFPARVSAEGSAGWGRAVAGGMASTIRDMRYGARVLLRRPGYALATIITLGIGVGGVATVYAVANWVLLRPVPALRDPSSLVTIQLEVKAPGSPAFPISEPDRATFGQSITSLQDLVGSRELDLNVTLGDGVSPRRLTGAVVSDDYFQLLGIRPIAGRLFEGGPNASSDADPATVVISGELWREEWADARDVVGQAIRIDGRTFTVVGVAPAGFHGAELPGQVQLWLPPHAFPLVDPGYDADVLSDRGQPLWTGLVGRLTPGASVDRAASEGLRTIEDVRATYQSHSFGADFAFMVYPGVGLSPRLREPVHRTLNLLAGAAAFLLLLALANATNLSLTHAAARRGSAAVQAALGAGRVRIGRRVLAEQALLGLSGGVAGVGVAAVVVRAFRGASLSELGASLQGIHLDGRVVAFTVVASLAATLLAGIVPAVSAGSGDLLSSLSGHRQGSRRTHRLQSGLVVAQVALSTLLLVGSGLLLRTVVNLRHVDPGFEPDHALRFSIDPRLQGYDDAGVRDLMLRVRGSLANAPGVVAAGFVSRAPIQPNYLTTAVFPSEGTWDDNRIIGAELQATPGFLDAMGARLVGGRDFTSADESVATPAGAPVVISRGMARAAWPDLTSDQVVGHTLSTPGRKPRLLSVIGVVADLRILGVTGTPPPLVIFPWGAGAPAEELTGWVRLRGRPEDFGPRVRSVIGALDPSLPVYGVATARARLDDLIVEQRVVARLALGLALVGLLLAGVGLHGVLGYAVTQRRREIGVRTALGARPQDLVSRLVRRGLLLTAAGALLGGAGATALSRVIAARLFQVAPLDPVTWFAGAGLLLVMSALAAWSPARRSTNVSPMEALSAE